MAIKKPPFLMGKETKAEEKAEKKLTPKQYAALERKEKQTNPKVHAKKR